MAFRRSDVLIPVDEVKLSGQLALDRDSKGLIIFAHGSGSGRLSPRNQFVANKLQADGFSTLLFDLLTIDEERADAVRSHLRFDIPFLAARLMAVTLWAQKASLIGALPAAYFGASTGAAAALLAAGKLPQHIQAVVSRGGRPDLASESLEDVKAPTLLIVGEHDKTVLTLNRQAAMKLETVRLEIVKGAGHLFEEGHALDDVADLASAWFGAHLKKKEKEKDRGDDQRHFGQLPIS